MVVILRSLSNRDWQHSIGQRISSIQLLYKMGRKRPADLQLTSLTVNLASTSISEWPSHLCCSLVPVILVDLFCAFIYTLAHNDLSIPLRCSIDLLKLDKYDITVYLRNPDQAQYLGTLGVKSVIGDRTNLNAIKQATLVNDVCIYIPTVKFFY